MEQTPSRREKPKNDLERQFLRLLKDESLLIKRVLYRNAPTKTPDYTIPELLEIDLETFIEVYPDWLRWVALDRRYPPTVIRKQPRILLDAFIYLDMLLGKMEGEFYEQLRKEAEAKK